MILPWLQGEEPLPLNAPEEVLAVMQQYVGHNALPLDAVRR